MDDLEEILRRFRDFCLVDLQLSERTTFDHIFLIRKFLLWLNGKPIEELTVEDLRKYLLQFRDGNPYTYANVLKSLKRFFRDFLGLPHLVQGFKFPTKILPIKQVPTKEDLKKFYEALDSIEERAIFLLIASSGLRRSEALNLELEDVDFEKRMIVPKHRSRTKKSYITFYNEEAEKALKEWLKVRPQNSQKLFPMRTNKKHRIFLEARAKTGLNITPQVLREWFCSEMGKLGIPDRYVDALCGRVPRSVLAKHYTDFNAEKLKEIYDETGLKVLVSKQKRFFNIKLKFFIPAPVSVHNCLWTNTGAGAFLDIH
ncbi:MAG: tyrosine-type recombinase/integrase [Candidatus Aenigmatarchaeota archaeon]